MVAVLHSLSSQKHIFPLPPPSDIQTWSTMNMLMSRFSVQLRRTFQSAKRNDENMWFLQINLANKCPAKSWEIKVKIMFSLISLRAAI